MGGVGSTRPVGAEGGPEGEDDDADDDDGDGDGDGDDDGDEGVAAKSPARNASTSLEREAGSKSFAGYLFFFEATRADVVNVRPSPSPVLYTHARSQCGVVWLLSGFWRAKRLARNRKMRNSYVEINRSIFVYVFASWMIYARIDQDQMMGLISAA